MLIRLNLWFKTCSRILKLMFKVLNRQFNKFHSWLVRLKGSKVLCLKQIILISLWNEFLWFIDILQVSFSRKCVCWVSQVV